jgi:hypothetical protein
MPVGKQYTLGPISVGPFYPENLPFGLKYLFQDVVNNPVETVNLNSKNNEEVRKYLARPSVNQSTPVVQSAPQQAMPVVDQEMSPSTMSPSGLSYLQRALALTQEQPDTASLQEYARARQAQGQQLMLNALAAAISGPKYQGLQQGYLRRAMAAQEPEQIGSGIAYGGKYISDPYAGRKEQANILAETGKELFRAEQEAAKAAKGQKKRSVGYSPDGTQIFVDQYGNSTTSDDTQYEGDIIPTYDWNKGVNLAKETIQSANQIDNILAEVHNDPDTFSPTVSALSRIPTTFGMQSAAMSAVLTPEQLEKRAGILKLAAIEVNKLYGAALSAKESERAKGFIPDAEDTIETILPKLKAAKQWAESSQRLYTPGQIEFAKGRMSSQRKIVKRGKRADGTPVVMYDDGSIE